jgi:hypothetical protein
MSIFPFSGKKWIEKINKFAKILSPTLTFPKFLRNDSFVKNLRNLVSCKYFMKNIPFDWNTYLRQVLLLCWNFKKATTHSYFRILLQVIFAKMQNEVLQKNLRKCENENFQPVLRKAHTKFSSVRPHKIPILLCWNLRMFYYKIFMTTASGLQLSNHFLPVSDPNLLSSLHTTNCS